MDGLRQVVPPTSCRGHFHPVEHTHSRVTSIYDPGPDRLSHPSFCTLCRGVDHTRTQCALAYLFPQTTRGAYQSRPAIRRSDNICISWNRGACAFPSGCVYKHICATCRQSHRAKDCPATPATSFFRRQAPQVRQPATSTQSS